MIRQQHKEVIVHWLCANLSFSCTVIKIFCQKTETQEHEVTFFLSSAPIISIHNDICLGLRAPPAF